jgi:peptidyl-prolyl cis-trans isomerase B (cyclophilin B)
MKKATIAFLILAGLSAFILTSCNKKPSRAAKESAVATPQDTVKAVAAASKTDTQQVAAPAEAAAQPITGTPQVKLETTLGEIVIELNGAKAPKTVANFLGYVNSGFYNGTIFHRVIKDFMIQGGGFSPAMVEKTAKEPIMNEADNGLKNLRGTVAMARTPAPHSASAQFFINTVDNSFLDFRAKTDEGWGYCVFGKVTKGLAVVDAIAKVPTTTNGMNSDVPVTPVIIKKVTVVKEPAAKKAAKK